MKWILPIAGVLAAGMLFSEKAFAPSRVPTPEGCVQLEVKKPKGEHDLAKAMAQAKAEKKFLLIQLGRENCTNCQKVWNMLGSGQVKLDGLLYADVSCDDPETMAQFQETFSVTDDGRYYPFLVVMGPDGSQMAFRSGLPTVEEINRMIEQAQADYFPLY